MPDPTSRTRLLVWGLVLVAAVLVGLRAYTRDDGGGGSPLPEIAVTDGDGAAPLAPGPDASASPDAAAVAGPDAARRSGATGDGAGARPAGGQVVVHVAGAVRAPGLYRLATGARIDDAVRRAGGPTRRADLSGVNLAAFAEDGRQILVPVRARPGSAVAATSGATASPPAAPVNLNTATLEQLDTLDGVGPATAQKIVDYREANGGFASVDELDLVSGIGEKRLAALRDLVTV